MEKLSIEEQLEIIKKVMGEDNSYWAQLANEATQASRVFSWDVRPFKDKE